MKPVIVSLTLAASAASVLAVLATPAGAQDYLRQDYLRVYGPNSNEEGNLRPPRGVGYGYGYAPGRAVVTRRVVVPDEADGIETSETVVTTRRVVRERSEPLAVYGGGVVARPLPAPVISKDPYGPPRYGVAPAYLGTPVVAPRARVVVEERRVETTRRYLAPSGPAPVDAIDEVDFED